MTQEFIEFKSIVSDRLNKLQHFGNSVDNLTADIEDYKKIYYPEKRFPEHRFKATKSGKYELVY